MKFNLRRIKCPVAVLLTALVLGGCAAINPSDPLAESIRTSDSDAVTDTDKARAASLIRVANSTARSGDISTAASLFRRAHEMDEMNPVPLIGLGNALSGLGAHEQAAGAYRRALDISSNDSDALHGLGNALIALDQPSAAIEQFEAALGSKKAASPRTYNGIGVAYDMMGDHASAQAFYQTGLKGTPRSMSLRNNLGLSMALAGQFKKAIELLRSVAADRRAGRRNRLNLALVYGLSGNNTAARQVARIDLDEPAVRRNLAYYRTLRALNDPKATLNAVGVGGIAPKGFTGKLSIGG